MKEPSPFQRHRTCFYVCCLVGGWCCSIIPAVTAPHVIRHEACNLYGLCFVLVCVLKIMLMLTITHTHTHTHSEKMDDMEHECYCQWFDHVTRQSPPRLDLIGMQVARTTTLHASATAVL